MAVKELVVQKFNIEDLNPAKYNPRKDLKPGDPEYEKLKHSIETFGYVDPLVVNVRDGKNIVVSGHQRLKVLKQLREMEVSASVVDMDELNEKALNIMLNNPVGDWDQEKLVEALKELEEAQYDMALTGFDEDSIDDIMSDMYDKDVKEDDFDAEEELKKPVFSKLGDLWFLGKHRIICGDSTKPETYERLMDGDKANLLLTDPPYLVAYKNSSGSIKNDDLDDQKGYEFLKGAFECFRENLSDDSSCYIFYATSKSRVFYDAYEDAGFKVACGLIWRKNSLVPGHGDYQQNFEPIIYGWKQGGKHKFYGDRKQTTCFDFDRVKNSKKEGEGHPTAKPVPLMAYLVKMSTNTNGIVLDGFHGSGATMMACEQLDRKARAVELDEKFVDVQVMRYRKYCQDNNKSMDDVYVIRDGNKMSFDEVMAAMEAES